VNGVTDATTEISTPDGGRLEVLESGTADGLPLLSEA
jgi:hypothetical protein